MVGICSRPLPGIPDPAGQAVLVPAAGGRVPPRPPAHIEGDSGGITNLGRFQAQGVQKEGGGRGRGRPAGR